MKRGFYLSYGKRVFDVFLSILALLLLLPVLIVIAVAILIDSRGPIIFQQRRVGKNGKSFCLYKFRTMIVGAARMQKKYQKLNEAHKPLFKIRDDPRFIRTGKFLSRAGLDELPQLINVLKGEMSLVGPRPLPVDEEKRIKVKFRETRKSVLPGITSPWVIDGAHSLSHKDWVKNDTEYIKTISFEGDVEILMRTTRMVVWQILSMLRRGFGG